MNKFMDYQVKDRYELSKKKNGRCIGGSISQIN